MDIRNYNINVPDLSMGVWMLTSPEANFEWATFSRRTDASCKHKVKNHSKRLQHSAAHLRHAIKERSLIWSENVACDITQKWQQGKIRKIEILSRIRVLNWIQYYMFLQSNAFLSTRRHHFKFLTIIIA